MSKVKQKYKGPVTKINVKSDYPNKKLAIVVPRRRKLKIKKT